jgi:hypothetical protein
MDFRMEMSVTIKSRREDAIPRLKEEQWLG